MLASSRLKPQHFGHVLIAAEAWRFSLSIFARRTRPPWAACRTAISTTSHCRPIGTPAIACSKRPGEHKITDLEWCEAQVWADANGDQFVQASIDTAKGRIDKTMRFCAGEPRVDFDLTFHWDDWGRGSLRLGHITLLPAAFDWDRLTLVTHNGGKDSETFSLAGQIIDHGAPVSFLVSSSQGLGMTEGWAELGDGKNRIRVTVDRQLGPLMGLLQHRRVGESLFCQLALSALELDETRKPDSYQKGPRRFRFSVNAVLA